MNSIGIGDLGSTNNRLNIEVTIEARGRADTNTFIGQFDMQRFTVHIRMNSNRLNA